MLQIARAVLTARLTPQGEWLPTVVLIYTVGEAGPFVLEAGPPPVRAGTVGAHLRAQRDLLEPLAEALREHPASGT